MIIETATIWAFFALFLTMITVATYFMVFFCIMYVVLWCTAQIVRPIIYIITRI